MGWLWRSSPSKEEPQQISSVPSFSDNAAPQPSPAAEAPGTMPSSSQSRPLSRKEQADAEFNQLLESLKADVSRTKSPQQSSNVSETPLSPSSPSPSGPPQPPSSIAPESLYPDSMSCRSAFDYAFFCQSFGGQFVNVYRYGELRSCSEHWDNFWLCMKARGMADEERKKVIRDHYRKKAIKYKTGPSSEDVWDLRREPVQHAFQGDFEALEREMKAEEEASRNADDTGSQTASRALTAPTLTKTTGIRWSACSRLKSHNDNHQEENAPPARKTVRWGPVTEIPRPAYRSRECSPSPGSYHPSCSVAAKPCLKPLTPLDQEMAQRNLRAMVDESTHRLNMYYDAMEYFSGDVVLDEIMCQDERQLFQKARRQSLKDTFRFARSPSHTSSGSSSG
ncbi:hypothetical protein KXV55_006890 [Aspergillus fumigatus]|nr:hypothetical protein KXV55_006890 [Aspergillus fumigatus]